MVAVVVLLALTLFLRRTMLGLAMRAAAEDFDVTRLMGIRANRVIATAFAISGLLAGVAAMLWMAQRGSVDPMMGFIPVLKAFIAAVLGGLGSLLGRRAGRLPARRHRDLPCRLPAGWQRCRTRARSALRSWSWYLWFVPRA